MATNTNLALVGTSILNGDAREINTDERASAGQTVTFGFGMLYLSGGAQIGAVNNATAITNVTKATLNVGSTSTRNRAGAFNYGGGSGNENGFFNVDESTINIFDTGAVDSFFSNLRDSLLTYFATSGSQLIRFRDTGSLTDCVCTSRGIGSVEIHGVVTIARNTLDGFSGGFISFSTAANIPVEGINFAGTITRLGFTSNGGLTVIDCSLNEVPLTLANILSFRYIAQQNTGVNHTAFAKRQTFSILTSTGAAIAAANTRYNQNGADLGSYTGAEVNHLQRLFRTNVVSAAERVFVAAEFAYDLSSTTAATSPIIREIAAYGYVKATQSYADYDSYEALAGTSEVLSLDPAVTETDAAVVAAYTAAETPSKAYDWSQRWTTLDFGRDLPVTLSGTALDCGTGNVVLSSGATNPNAGGDLVQAAGGTTTIYLGNGGVFTGDIITTGTFSLTSGATISGSVKSSAGTVVRVSGLPSGVAGAALAWLQSDGSANAFNNPVHQAAVGGEVELTLENDTAYFIRVDAVGYERQVYSLDTTNETSLAVSLQQFGAFADGTFSAYLPATLTVAQQAIADLIRVNVVNGATPEVKLELHIPNAASDGTRYDAASNSFTFQAADFVPIAYAFQQAMLGQTLMSYQHGIDVGNSELVWASTNTAVQIIQAPENPAGLTINFGAFTMRRIGDGAQAQTFINRSQGHIQVNFLQPSAAQSVLSTISGNVNTIVARVPDTVPTVAEIADAVLDEAVADHAAVGSAGAAIAFQAPEAPTAAAIADAIADEPLSEHAIAGSIAAAIEGFATSVWSSTGRSLNSDASSTIQDVLTAGLARLSGTLDGSTGSVFSTAALVNAPSSGGGGTVDEAAIATATRTELERVGGSLDILIGRPPPLTALETTTIANAASPTIDNAAIGTAVWATPTRGLTTGAINDIVLANEAPGTAVRILHDLFDNMVGPVGGGAPQANSNYEFHPHAIGQILNLTPLAGFFTNAPEPASNAQVIAALGDQAYQDEVAARVWMSGTRTLSEAAGLTTGQSAILTRLEGTLDGASGSVFAAAALANAPVEAAIEAGQIVTALLDAPYGSRPDGSALMPGTLGEHWWQFYPPEIVRQLLNITLDGSLAATRFTPTAGAYGDDSLGAALQLAMKTYNHAKSANVALALSRSVD